MPEDHNLVSFDVKSLFTCIPIDFALQSVEERLNDPNLPENLKPIPSNAFMTLLKICMSSNTL